MEYHLKYGDSVIKLNIPRERVLNFIEVHDRETETDNREVLRQALRQPLNAPPLPEAVAGKHVVALVEDATRDIDVETLADVISAQLTTVASLTVIIATGTHDPETPGNHRIRDLWRRYLLSRGIPEFDVLIHDCRAEPFDDYGETPTYRNRLLVNPLIRKAEAFLVFSDMKNHYFAGYSNAIKDFLPGVCAFETTERNHALALKDASTFGHHPWHPDPARRHNPVAQDMVEAYHLIVGDRPAYLVATIEKNHRMLWAAYGDLKTVTIAGIQEVDRLMSRTVQPADLLIVSPGGYPNDESIYIAQRALELSKNALKPGGHILFLAECRNGIGPRSARKNFYDLLAQPIPQVLELLEKKYVLYSHKAYKFARLMQQTRTIAMVTALEREVIEKIHLQYVDDPQEFVNKLLAEKPDLTINIVNDGNKIALHRSSRHPV
jgi:nickel-dependent lactate racemase